MKLSENGFDVIIVFSLKTRFMNTVVCDIISFGLDVCLCILSTRTFDKKTGLPMDG